MSFFQKFKEGLSKTRDFMTAQINRMAAGLGVFDEDMLDDLEMTLVQADCGVTASMEAIDDLREYIRSTGNASREACYRLLQKRLEACWSRNISIQNREN